MCARTSIPRSVTVVVVGAGRLSSACNVNLGRFSSSAVCSSFAVSICTETPGVAAESVPVHAANVANVCVVTAVGECAVDMT